MISQMKIVSTGLVFLYFSPLALAAYSNIQYQQISNRYDIGMLCIDSRETALVRGMDCANIPEQHWLYDPDKGQIKNSKGLCLDIQSSLLGEANLDQVVARSCNNSVHQKWVRNESDQSMRSSGGHCLDINGGNHNLVQIYECYNGPHQKWQIALPVVFINKPAPAPEAVPLEAPRLVELQPAAPETPKAIAVESIIPEPASIIIAEPAPPAATLVVSQPAPIEALVQAPSQAPTPSEVPPAPVENTVFSAINLSLLQLPTTTVYSDRLTIDRKNGLHITGRTLGNSLHNGPCLIIRDSRNITIERNRISDCNRAGFGHSQAIQIINSQNITIRENHFSNTDLAIFSDNSTNVIVERNQFSGTAGGFTAIRGSGIQILSNRFSNMVRGPRGLSGFVQFDKVNGSGNRISCNVGNNEESVVAETRDIISIYKSSGTAADPILIYGNRIRHSLGVNRTTEGVAAAGIQTGDSSFSDHIRVIANALVNVGGTSLSVSGGSNIEVAHNQIYSQRNSSVWTVGIDAKNFYAANETWRIPGAYCRNINIHNNKVNIGDSSYPPILTQWDNGWPNCENISLSGNSTKAAIDEHIFDTPAPACSGT